LSHDIGHPPFGHEGEKVLDKIMKKHGSGFDHNLHALRIVEDFEVKYPAFRGLNLTYEVREGIVKHSSDWQDSARSYIDLSEYEPSVKPPLEAQVIDLADEIAYNAADLDDGYRSGLLGAELIQEEVPLFKSLSRTVRNEHPRAPERIWVGETLRRLIDFLVTDLIESTWSEIRDRGVQSVEDVRQQNTQIVSLSRATARLNQSLKRFLNKRLYANPALRQARLSARELIAKLFGYYLLNPQALPAHHRSRLRDSRLPRVVCDYIAGMTDGFAQQQLEKIH
jgi:dGTPase